jgi:hypothetical protein
MKLLLSAGLLLSSLISFGQINYLDKGMGSEQILKLGASAMDKISETNIESVKEDCAPRAHIDTVALKEAASKISEEYQASEGHEPVTELKENFPNSFYERTFYQTTDDGRIQYLLQVHMAIAERSGKAVITAIQVLKGPAVKRYDRILKADDGAEPVEKKAPPVRHKKGEEEEED